MKGKFFIVGVWLSLSLSGFNQQAAFALSDSYSSNQGYESSYSRWDTYKLQNNYQDSQRYRPQNRNWFQENLDSLYTGINNFLENTAGFLKTNWNNAVSSPGIKSVSTPETNPVNIGAPDLKPAPEIDTAGKSNIPAVIGDQSLAVQSKSITNQPAKDEPDIIYTPKTFNDHAVSVLNRAEQSYSKSPGPDSTGFTFLSLVAGETVKEIGSLFTSYEYKSHVFSAKNQECIKVIYSNGIANNSPEGFAPSYAGSFKGTLLNSGEDRNQVYLLPLYENGHIVTDAASWLADLTTNKLTNEVIAKMDNELSTRPPDQKNNPITAVLYSGSYNPFMKALNQRPDYNVGAVVAVGGAWPVKENTYFNQSALNPNLKLVVNIYGSNDILYKSGLAGNMKLNNVETVNIEILGAGHMDYFDNPKMSEINVKTEAFITRAVVAVNHGGNELNDLLEAGFVKYDKKSQSYMIDADKINFR